MGCETEKIARVLSPAATFGVHGGSVFRVAFSPDGFTVAATDAHRIILWDAYTGREISRWDGPRAVSMFGLAFSPDGKTLASGGPNFEGRRFHLSNIFQRYQDAGASQGEIDLWEVPSGRLKSTLVDGKWIIQVAFSPNGKLIATSGDDNTARLWDVP